MAKQKITAIIATENVYKITLSVDGVALTNHNTITAAKLRTTDGLTLADSTVVPADWDFTNTGFLIVKLGLANIAVGEYTCKLIIKDGTHTTGLAWLDTDIILTILP